MTEPATEKRLGHLATAQFLCLPDGRVGFAFSLKGPGWEMTDFHGTAAGDGQNAEAKNEALALACMTARAAMATGRKLALDQLAALPIQADFIDGQMKTWRILEEVLP